MTHARVAMVVATAAAMMALPVALGACGGDESKAEAVTARDFDRGNFSNPTRIDNKWSPLAPGTEFVLEGRANRGRGRLPHRVVSTVTDLTKVIDGVRTVVLWERDYNAGRLLEGELAFQAQDDDGNLWNFGEYPEQYDGGKFDGAPDTWISGLAGAKAGILMRGDPRVGTPSYLQGWAPKIHFEDRAKVYRTDQRACVPLDCYRHVLVTDETNPSEPLDGHQRKYYAPGVGTIRAAPVGGKEKEVLVLVGVAHLSPKALAEVRREALILDKRAYVTKKDVYGHTPPAEHTRTGGLPQ